MDKTYAVKPCQRVDGVERAHAFYQNDDDPKQWVRADISNEAYAALALPGAGEPQPRPELPAGKWTWRGAVGGVPVFDTPTGELKPGDFFPGDAKMEACFIHPDTKAMVLLGSKDHVFDGVDALLVTEAASPKTGVA